MPTFSTTLETAIHSALGHANERHHELATLEHLLLALIDEPDAHIHPDLQVRFADFVFQIAKHFKLQVVVATHSVSLLAALGQFGGERASVIYINRKRAEYKAQRFQSVQKTLSACLGGHVLMGPLFGFPILLVEGDDDYRIWSQVPRHHIASFAVIPSNGDEIKKYQKTLEQIFASLREIDEEPCGYALLDGDKNIPEPNEDNPQRNIRFVGLQCHESENLYLSDEVMSDLGTTWHEAAQRISERANDYGQAWKGARQCSAVRTTRRFPGQVRGNCTMV